VGDGWADEGLCHSITLKIMSISSISLVLGSALLSACRRMRASRRTATGEIVPAAILRDGRAKHAASSRVCESFGVYVKAWPPRIKCDSLSLTIRRREMVMEREGQLFEGLPEQCRPRIEGRGAAGSRPFLPFQGFPKRHGIA